MDLSPAIQLLLLSLRLRLEEEVIRSIWIMFSVVEMRHRWASVLTTEWETTTVTMEKMLELCVVNTLCVRDDVFLLVY